MEVFCGNCRRIVGFSGERPKFCGHCGQPLTSDLTAVYDAAEATAVPAPTSPAPPRQPGPSPEAPASVGGYKLLRPLGGGAMGTVYEAEDSSSGRLVAVKLIVPELTDSAQALERFRQEGRLASTIAHPRSVFVLAADEDAGRPYIVMELMPGSTLDDLVQKQGPLPPEAAITRILDVIDGLEAAHERGLIHRDVKPSNCFLEASGRVKVGDFGLAKSAGRDARLTRTGTFLGTPLFAAPEQIKCEIVDVQSDVYSVAATLYFLLTGRAPFQSGDSMATLARIVSEDPTPLRRLRPEIPRSLDKVVLRGLERDRRRRWRSLDDFRKALVPFLPAEPSIGGMGLRLVAYVIDTVVMVVLQNIIFGPLVTLSRNLLFLVLAKESLAMGTALAYFGLLEGIWGWSLGKRLLRLRVGTVTGNPPPGLRRALLRTAILIGVLNLGGYLATVLLLASGLPVGDLPNADELDQQGPRFEYRGRPVAVSTEHQWILIAVGLLSSFGTLLGVLAILAPMRPMNGFRGLHELWSGTRTYRLRWPWRPRRQPLESWRFSEDTPSSDRLPQRLGPFCVLGVARESDRDQLLLAEDPQLGRRVWIWRRPLTQPALGEAQCTINRSTRARWVACGTDDLQRWDAFLAVDGATLPQVVTASGLSWAQTRPILEDLVEELAAAGADGTLPECLTTDQVWAQPYGRAQLLGTGGGDSGQETPEARVLRFLRDVAVLALEGRPRPPDARATSIRALVPVHAESMLDRLLGVGRPYHTIAELHKDLEATRDRPTRVTPLRRLGHLALTALAVSMPLTIMLAVSVPSRGRSEDAVVYGMLWFCVGFLSLWALLFRGGLVFYRGGLALRRADGRKASRLQCASRAFLVWAPMALLLSLAHLLATQDPGEAVLARGLWVSALLLLLGYAALAIRFPTRSLHDRLAGTYLVPE